MSLNKVIIKDAYPLPRVDECLDSLAGATWFIFMDLNFGFWQIAMAPEDKQKTSLNTSLRLYQFTVMPFGLAKAPSTFERLMENVHLVPLLAVREQILSLCLKVALFLKVGKPNPYMYVKPSFKTKKSHYDLFQKNPS